MIGYTVHDVLKYILHTMQLSYNPTLSDAISGTIRKTQYNWYRVLW